jgi:hypothetical protein
VSQALEARLDSLDLGTLHDESRVEVRNGIEALESAIGKGVLDGEFEQTIFEGGTPEGDAQCQHYFGDGVYVRTLMIPAGTCVIGRLHLQARVCMILSGTCRFVDEFQEHTVSAPWVGEFKPGTKTAVFAETDTLWAACMGTDLKDPQTAFYKLTLASHDELAGLLENRSWPGQQSALQ